MGPRTPLLQSIVFVGALPITITKRLGFGPEHGEEGAKIGQTLLGL